MAQHRLRVLHTQIWLRDGGADCAFLDDMNEAQWKVAAAGLDGRPFRRIDSSL